MCYGYTVSEGGSGDVRVPAVKQLFRGVSGCVRSVKSQHRQRMLIQGLFVASATIYYNCKKKKLQDVFLKVRLRFIRATYFSINS